MLDKPEYTINLELTTPDKTTVAVAVKPEEIFSYNTAKSKIRLCYK